MSDLLGEFPRLFPKPAHTIEGIGRRLRERSVSCVEVLQACLDQVDEWEPKVHAWVILDRDQAMEQAQALDAELKSGGDRGPLHGIPIAIKDIIDVAGLPTACGSRRWANQIANSDAEVVAKLREAGAVIMGKTVTTPYAWIDPPVTRNPWNLDRTPGGSSSGSAAAVACGMCLGAIGTQTGGSITRPASFCGVAGMKPSQILTRRDGIFPFAPTLDHVGPIARSVADIRIMFATICTSSVFLDGLRTTRETAPRLGRMRGFFDGRAEAAARSKFDSAVAALKDSGVEVIDLDDPLDFERVLQDHRCVMAAEAAGTHSHWLDAEPADYPPRITELIVEGRAISALQYLRAKARKSPTGWGIMSTISENKLDALITPAALGTAPDSSTTGDPAFNSMWSYTELPTVSFPIDLAPDGLPVAAQFTGIDSNDAALLNAAEWCEQAIRSRWECSRHAPRDGNSSRGT
jgi:aspartyl-tRNA(Asn)/glutamyl-tRNA(Gln) amidotransferase subunit A